MRQERDRRTTATDEPMETRGGDGRTIRHEAGDGRTTRSDSSLPQLVRELADESSELVREEVALAKAEMREKLNTYQAAAGSMAVGGALLLAGLLTLLWAVNRGLTALLAQWMAVDVAVWLSPLILTVLMAGIGWSMVKGGQRRMKSEGLTPHRTKASLEENRSWARSKARDMKAEAKHG